MSSNNKSIHIKEYMAKMPDTFTTKKEIDEYYKTGWKDIKKEDAIERPKKRVKRDETEAQAEANFDLWKLPI